MVPRRTVVAIELNRGVSGMTERSESIEGSGASEPTAPAIAGEGPYERA